MTFNITFFCESGKSRAADAFESLVREIGSLSESLEIRDRKDGDGWVWCELSTVHAERAQPDKPIALELHSDPIAVSRVISDYGDEVNAQRIANADLIITLTSVGDAIDLDLVRNVWLSVARLWPMVPHSDVSGFDIDLNSLA